MTRSTFVGFVVLALGCDVELEEDESAELGSSEEADPIFEIIENLRAAGYPDAEIEVREDGVVFVGGDAEVSLEASREMVGLTASGAVDDDVVDFRQYHTTNLVSTTHDTICVNGSAFTGTLSTALDNAIANYTNLDLSFNLVRTSGAAAGCDATITAVLVNGTGGSAGFPSGGLPYGTINIGDDIVSTHGLGAATHVITHELGHCFGFRHSDYYDRSISCGWGDNEGDAGVGAVQIPGTPANAVYNGSVMNSCYNGGSTGQWASTDLTALNTLYPPRVTSRIDKNGTIVPGQGSWGSWHPTVYCKPGTYAVGYRMRVESSQGGGLSGGNDDTALNAVQLLCKDPATGATSLISSHDGLWGSWHSTASCSGSNNYLKTARIRIESSQGGDDDTAANDVEFGCSQGEIIDAPGGHTWGSWYSWKQCQSGTAVCGLRSRFESSQGGGDDTAMNGLELACCNLDGSPPPPPPPPPPPDDGGGGCLIAPCPIE